MQRWIYTQRPRKPFTKRERVGGDTIPKFFTRDIIVSGRTHSHPSKKDIQANLNRIGNRSLKNRITNILIAVSIVALTTVVLIKYEPWNSSEFATRHYQEMENQAIQNKNAAYLLSMDFGKYHFAKGDIETAKIEFHKALELSPDSKEAMVFLCKAYLQDCLTNEVACAEAESYLNNWWRSDPENAELLSYKLSLDTKP